MALVERDQQLEFLNKLFDGCVRGRGRVVVVRGPVASGKTTLLHTFARRVVDAGATYLDATASRTEQMLPFGVLSQIFRAAKLSGEQAEHVNGLLDDGALAAALHEGDPEIAQAIAPMLDGLGLTLVALAETAPLVLGIDDVHYADEQSLLCLSYLARRVGSARVLVVVNECAFPRPSHPLLHGDLLRQPNCSRIRLDPLSRDGVATLLGRRLDPSRAAGLADTFHRMTGGNPLLVNALIGDLGTGAWDELAEAVAGKAFDLAVVACLHRCESTMLRVARALAVLDEPAAPALVGRLLDLSTDVVARAAEELGRAGFIDSDRFRHPCVPAAVLNDMQPEERAAMHLRVAQVLRQDGASAARVAPHVIAADRLDGPWVIPLLQEAAEQALSDGDTERALTYLRTALQACHDDDQRLAIRSMLMRAEWRIDPSTAMRSIDELVAAVHDGRLANRHAVMLAQYLLWYGRYGETVDILRRLGSLPTLDLDTELGLTNAQTWLSYAYPTRTAQLPRAGNGHMYATVDSTVQATTAMWRVLQDGADDETIGIAEQVLHRTRLDDSTLGAITTALSALVLGDRLDVAETWCNRLIDRAALQRAPTWRAVLTAVRAEMSLRKGDLPNVERQVRAALTLITPKSWGVAVGLPLGTMLRAATAMGNYRVAVNHLSIPVPPAMFETPVGLHYLYARGRLYMATGRHQGALSDFHACGDLMSRWKLDLPALVPWRAAAAQAYLRLDRRGQARELIEQQLARLRPGHLRARGFALRVLAATSDTGQRPALLDEAVSALKEAQDRLELAYTFADLSQALQATGEFKRAEMTMRTAHQIAGECHVATLLRTTTTAPVVGAGPGGPAPKVPDDHPVNKLSSAERRVAALAALGHSNREIAGRLCLTVSTVEQHLTRVYRKLRVSRRTDLPPELHLDAVEQA